MDENITNVDQFIEGAVVLKEKPYFTDEKLRNFAQMMLDAQVYELDVESDVGIGKPKMRIWIRHPNFTKAENLSDIMTMAYRALNGLLCEVFRAQWHTKELQAEIRSLQSQQTSRALDSDEFTFIIDAINPDWHDAWIDHAQQSSQYSQRTWRVLADFIRRQNRVTELEVEAYRRIVDEACNKELNVCGCCTVIDACIECPDRRCSELIQQACEAQARAEVKNNTTTEDAE